jgi:peptide/nickel transport system ATP-binding protein
MSAPVLEISNLIKDFPIRTTLVRQILQRGHGPAVRAVDDISFSLVGGEVLGIVGESGCGKSTTGMIALKLLAPTSGSIRFAGDDVTAYRGRRLLEFRRRAQIIFQDPYQSLNPRFTVADIVAEPLTIHGLARGRAAHARVVATLDEAGLRPAVSFLDRFPHELSGGQRQRVAIARAIVLEPKFIVADEPVSMLDVSVRAGILRLIRSFSRDAGMSVIYISHDISTVRYLCDRTAVMYLGRIVEAGPTRSVLDAPKHPYTRALIAAVPRIRGAPRRRVGIAGDSSAARPSGCVFHPRCPEVREICRSTVPQLRPLDANRNVACHLYHDDDAAVGQSNSAGKIAT